MRFRKIDMNAGLSHNSVLCVTEDHDQFIWIGTREGLNKYNSVDVTIYKHKANDSLSLSNNHINCIYETDDNELWVGTARGLNKFDRPKEHFVQYLLSADSTGISNGYVKCITEAFDGSLWIGTSNGINIYQHETNSFRHVYPEEPPTYSNNVIALFQGSNGLMWIGTKGGLYVWQDGLVERVYLGEGTNKNKPFEIRDIKQDQEGLFWVATEEYGVYSFQYLGGKAEDVGRYHIENSNLVSNHVRKLYLDGSQLWMATLDGLCILDKEKNEITPVKYSPRQPEGISNSSVHDVTKDSSGGFWLATYTGGANYYHPQNNLFPHYQKVVGVENSLGSNAINGFLEDAEGNLFISTGDAGINLIDRETKQVKFILSSDKNGISNNIVKSMAADPNGNLWIGTYNGLNFFDRKKNTITKYFHIPGNGNSLNQNQVHVVHVDGDGLVWIGMNSGAFQVFDPQTQVFTSIPEAGRIVNTIFEDQEGRLWIGDRFGLKCLDKKTKQLIDISHLTNNYGEQLNYINWISQDQSGKIWIGTQGSGLFIFKGQEVFWFDKDKGLIANTVNAILEDDSGTYWISTNKGISKVIYSENDQGQPQLQHTDFSKIHGLQGLQFEPGSAMKSDSGKLYFGGINGYNAFFPHEVEKLVFFPPVVLSSLLVNFKEADNNIKSPIKAPPNVTKALVLEYNQRNIFIRFAGINFIDPAGTYYRYMLDGQEWVDIGTQMSINFTYLPIGTHELRIKASTKPNQWGEGYKSLSIKVLAPWWLTWWAFVLYALFLGFLLYMFFRYSQKWAELKNSLGMEQFKREKELELHESKLKFFTDVSHELRTPLTLILAPIEQILLKHGLDERVNTQLLLIRKNGNRMMQLIDQVLNLRKLETGHEKLKAAEGNVAMFLKEISLAFNEIATSRDIQFEFRVDDENMMLWYDRDKLEIIVYNLLSNAFKNAPSGGTVLLQLKQTAKIPDIPKTNPTHAEISVTDNGKGISKTDIQHIFDRFYKRDAGDGPSSKGFGVGLELTRRMVGLHKGEITVESRQQTAQQAGTTQFSVFLPLGKSHLAKDEMITDFKNSEHVSLYGKELQFREKLDFELIDGPEVELPRLSDKERQTLLIVEDNPEVRAFVRDLFIENYLVEEAENGISGWTKATQLVPDLVISDIMMPEMNGIELCRNLKTDVRTSHIPVILLTARTTLAFKYEGIETGADEYITKPFSAQYLILRVKNLIKQRESMRNHFLRTAILEPEKTAVTSVDERLLKKAADYINENIQNPELNVEHLSKELGLSRVHFYRKIKALTNLTAVDFVRSIRLKKAAMLLQQGKLSVKEIMVMAGFDNADYFRKCFKVQFGKTPTEYANENMGKATGDV